MGKPDSAEIQSYRIDTMRQGIDGTFQPLIDSIFLIVAISVFAVDDFWKGLIAASSFIGFLLSAPLTGMLNRTGIRRSVVLVVLTAIAAVGLAVGGITKSGIGFAVAVSTASAAIHLRQPFFTDLYGEVYPIERRAERISLGLRLKLVLSLGTGLFYGWLLDIRLAFWRMILGLGVILMVVSATALIRLPQVPPVPRKEPWWQAMSIPFCNPVFLYIQLSWMIIGFGNLWVLPLRAVFLAEEERGLGLSPILVALILVVIPSVVRLIFNPLWARLYQKLSFPALRILINFFFLTSIPLFFLTEDLPVIITASVLFGIGTSGSPFIWQLWVTRIAEASQVRIYQSAHAFLAGLRGIIAPFVGFAVLEGLSFQAMGLISGGLALLASLMLLPLMRTHRKF